MDSLQTVRGAGSSVLESVITTAELSRRPSRPADYENENRVLLKLAKTMAHEPRLVLQELVDGAREFCRAGSAGVSLLEPELNGCPSQFRWVATAGAYSHLVGNTMPREFSPCGTVLDRDQLLLMTDPTRHFGYMEALAQPACEVLLVPFYRRGELMGTVWVVAHSSDRRFEQEDARLVTSLSQFAAAAVQSIETAGANLVLEEQARRLAEQELERLSRENRRIAGLMTERDQADAKTQRELKDTRLLRDVAARSIGAGDSSALLEAILDAALVITDASAGTIQLLDANSQSLTFLATRGFSADMVSHFKTVDMSSGSSCGVALARSQRTFVVFDDPHAPDADGALKLHFDCGFRCAQSTPLSSRAGQPLGMFSTHWRERRELTERELRFLDLLGRQAADLIERSQVLEALRLSEGELREADRRKDEFLAVLAHELRNPLVPIRNGIELLKLVAENPLIEEVRPMMERQVAHAVRLIDGLLDVSRINSGKIELQREFVTVFDVVESALEANRSAIANAGLELQVEFENPDRRLEVDATRLPQVISNVLHNATKFTARGGRVALRTEWVANETAPPELIVRVTDTGVGISRESLSRVFDLFAQVHADNSIRHGGLGIGLALAQKLVELHGGSIRADSDGPGKGSVFTIRIPAPFIPSSRAALSPFETNHIAGLRVLVVDDNADAADSLGVLIAKKGGDVRIAYDGTQALEIVKSFAPALVLLDIGMPDVDGYQTCQQIRREKGTMVSIVAVTGWGQEADRRRAEEAGFDAHLTKPIEFSHLAALAASAPRPSE